MHPGWEQRNFFVDGSEIQLWSAPVSDFSCRPDAIRSYIDGERWDLVFNALYYLSGAVEEGIA